MPMNSDFRPRRRSGVATIAHFNFEEPLPPVPSVEEPIKPLSVTSVDAIDDEVEEPASEEFSQPVAGECPDDEDLSDTVEPEPEPEEFETESDLDQADAAYRDSEAHGDQL